MTIHAADGYVRLLDWLRTRGGVELTPGLTEREVQRAEEIVGAEMPADLKSLLSRAQPIGGHFVDWRKSVELLREEARIPIDGILFDVGVNRFWFDDWPPRPDNDDEALALAESSLLAAPRLFPLRANKYVAADRPDAGNPVFSCSQADILVVGTDLLDYFARWRGFPHPDSGEEPRHVPFWSVIASN